MIKFNEIALNNRIEMESNSKIRARVLKGLEDMIISVGHLELFKNQALALKLMKVKFDRCLTNRVTQSEFERLWQFEDLYNGISR